jgi:nucleotide-binding universal stress UspA family protein
MSWKPIVVGVDSSPAAAGAAQLGLKIAAAAGVGCRMVHASRDPWTAVADAASPEQSAAFLAAARWAARKRVQEALAGQVPGEVLRDIDVGQGWPPAVLDDAVREARAGLLVLGAKHHTALGRWLGGSTVHNVARMLRAPLLVTGTPPAEIRRVLVAVDTSAAAGPTLEAAARFADLFAAELRVLHVIEPLPILPEVPPPANLRDYEHLLEEECAEKIWPLVRPDTEKVIRHAIPDAGIHAEATAWQADVVVVGSHGKGFVERMLVGSVTERLLNQLPSPMLLVVPAGKLATPTARRRPGAAKTAAGVP